MATKTKSSGKMGVGMRIILFIAGIALIALCLRGVALTFFGATATAEIYDTDKKTEYSNSDNKRNMSDSKTVIKQSYKFTVDGKEYKGVHQVSKKNKVGNVIKEDQKFVEDKTSQKTIKVKYLKFWPGLNSAEEAAKPGLGTALYGLGGVLGIVLLVFAFKPSRKKKAPEAVAPPQTDGAGAVCPHCGAPVSGPFCPSCGAKLGE